MITKTTKNTVYALANKVESMDGSQMRELINYVEILMKLEYNRGLQEGITQLSNKLKELDSKLKGAES